MPRVAPAQHSHSAAEISPQLFNRPDFARHSVGVERMRGFVAISEGPALRLPGTRFVGNTHNDAEARLMAVQLFDQDSYVLEWTNLLLRFWREEALIGGPSTWATPYETSDLENIQFEPSADRVYLVDAAHHPQRLTRTAVDAFTLEDTPFEQGPFRPQNTDDTQEMTVSALTGSITVTTNFDIFDADHVGAFFRLTEVDKILIPEWQSGTVQGLGFRCRYQGNTYEIVGGAGNVGVTPPTHTEGDVLIQPGGVIWRFIHDGSGVIKITAVTDARTATADVITDLPNDLTAGTFRWQEGAWSDFRGYPTAIAQTDQRMIYAGTPTDPLGTWWSALGRFLLFRPSTLADQSFSYIPPPPKKQLTSIRWIDATAERVHFGCGSGEVIARPIDDAQGYTSETTRFFVNTTKGTSKVQAINIDGVPVFLGPDGIRLYGLAYRLENDRVAADPLTLAARHILRGRVRWMAWQEVPWRVLWLGTFTGDLVSLTYEPEQGVIGFAKHVIPGEVEWGTVKSTDDDLSEELWLSVKRTINSTTRRHIEIMQPPFGLDNPADDPPNLEDAWHLWAAVRYQGVATTTITGLGHLEGEAVYSWTNVGVQGPYTVASGQITLDTAATSAITGLDNSANERIRYLPLQPGTTDGGSEGQDRVSRGVGPRLLWTAGGNIRTVEMNEYGELREGTQMDLLREYAQGRTPPFLFSGPTDLDPKIGWTPQLQYEIRPDPGAPITVQGITPRVHIAEN